MKNASKRLLALRVADVMSKEVVSLSSCDTMAHAARELVEHAISGAPVVDLRKDCAGVLSATDFMKQQVAGGNSIIEEQAAQFGDVDLQEEEKVEYGDELVSRCMTANVNSIADNQTLLSAARTMWAQHVHRLPVLDERGHVAGIITALDIVGALVNAFED